MTAQQIASIVGVAAQDYERRMLAAADDKAAAFLAAGQGVMMSGSSQHFAAFRDIHVAIDGEADYAELRGLLDEWDRLTGEMHGEGVPCEAPSDAACNLYTPQLGAAYYFGLALGLRLAGGAR
jgi:hypothetical protein